MFFSVLRNFKNSNVYFSLQQLQRELEISKDAEKATLNDVLHEQNVKQGRDKYKTLKQIRSGNTKHRVDQFEAL
jgi:lysyl-tRNA synthetase class I